MRSSQGGVDMLSTIMGIASTIGNIFAVLLFIASILGLIDLPAQYERWKTVMLDRMGLRGKLGPWGLALCGFLIVLVSNVEFLGNIVMSIVDKSTTRARVDTQEFYIMQTAKHQFALFLLLNVHNMSEPPVVLENFELHVLDAIIHWGRSTPCLLSVRI
jgi:hypothetical protein